MCVRIVVVGSGVGCVRCVICVVGDMGRVFWLVGICLVCEGRIVEVLVVLVDRWRG